MKITKTKTYKRDYTRTSLPVMKKTTEYSIDGISLSNVLSSDLIKKLMDEFL